MRLEIYISEKLIAPFKEDKETSYKVGWMGTLEQLKTQPSDDDKILETVFDAFNSDKRPADLNDGLRSLTVGDVVNVENRAYKCLAEGWQKLDNFTTQNSHEK